MSQFGFAALLLEAVSVDRTFARPLGVQRRPNRLLAPCRPPSDAEFFVGAQPIPQMSLSFGTT